MANARYGTIIVDLERQCPVALLNDREAETVAAWLKEHPTVRIIARDRAGASAEGATSGAPQAIQMADKFHRLQNLADMLLLVFEDHAKLLRDATGDVAPGGQPSPAAQPAAAARAKDVARALPPPRQSPNIRRSQNSGEQPGWNALSGCGSCTTRAGR